MKTHTVQSDQIMTDLQLWSNAMEKHQFLEQRAIDTYVEYRKQKRLFDIGFMSRSEMLSAKSIWTKAVRIWGAWRIQNSHIFIK